MLKRILLPPLLPVVLIAALAIWVIIDETKSPPRIIDGRPDNAPRLAAGILFYGSPLLLIPFGLLNLADSLFDRFSNRVAWTASVGLWILLSTLLMTIFCRSDGYSLDSPGLRFSIVAGFMFLMPMTLLRRLLLAPRQKRTTEISAAIIPFETLFPNATCAPKLKRPEQTGAGQPATQSRQPKD